MSISLGLKKIKSSLYDPLYKNSFFLVLSRILNMGAGFVFWVIAAKLYTVEDVGKATALLSSLGLIILLSRLGFDFSLIRFIAGSDKNQVFNTCLSITTASTLGICLFYIVVDSFLPSPLLPGAAYAVLFTVVAILNSVSVLTGNMFWALRNAQHYLTQNIIMSLRLVLLFLLLNLHTFGIFLSMGICHGLASLLGVFLLKVKGFKINFLEVSRPFLKKSLNFSLGNYFSNNLYEAPGLILPIMVLHLLGEANAAQYYISFMLGNLTIIIPAALSTSLFVEGSHERPLKENVIKSGLAAYLSLLFCSFLIFFLGKDILGFISKDYVKAFPLLRLVVLSNFFEVMLLIYIAVQNVRMKVRYNVKINLLRFVLILGLGYFFIKKFYLLGVGWALLVTYFFLTCIILFQIWREAAVKAETEN
ncbi:MAG: oligosaccharide flippase family protein [Clostridia bacterium]|nr:oligosaccharide flippase family protein [Clostridia bacterium]